MGDLEHLFFQEKFIKKILEEYRPRTKEFQKGEIILKKDTAENRLCLLLKGTAYLYIENEYDTRQLLDFFMRGQLMCHEMLPTPNDGYCYIQAKHPCTVVYLDWPEPAGCTPGKQDRCLAAFLPLTFRSIIAARNEHCHMLQQKTIRSKLLAFLHYQRIRQGSRTIRIPIPYSDLAEYLTIDRTSLMTELSKMDAEGLIHKKAYVIRLEN